MRRRGWDHAKAAMSWVSPGERFAEFADASVVGLEGGERGLQGQPASRTVALVKIPNVLLDPMLG